MLREIRHFLCNVLGYVLFMPPAFVTHFFWSLYGMLAYPLALLGCDAKTIKEPLVVVVGPMYVSSKFFKSWMYYGCEPEGNDDQNHLVIDRTFAPRFWMANKKRWYSENLRGSESLPLAPGAVIERK